MLRIGYSLTWKSRCTLTPQCGRQVFAHTNGYGDFVLFDSLGWPWLVHDCYLLALGLADSPTRVDIYRSRDIPFDSPKTRPWELIRTMNPDPLGPRKRFDVLGTVTNTERSFIGRNSLFRGLPRTSLEEIRRVLGGRRDLVTLVTGEGEEFSGMIDLAQMPLQFNDIVAARLKAVPLLNISVFLVTDAHTFESREGSKETGLQSGRRPSRGLGQTT